jgi:hypothetical protein
MKAILVLAGTIIFISCTNSNAGWNRSYRDKLMNSCISEAKRGNAAIDDQKLKTYCECYQQNLEKKYPETRQMEIADKSGRRMHAGFTQVKSKNYFAF